MKIGIRENEIVTFSEQDYRYDLISVKNVLNNTKLNKQQLFKQYNCFMAKNGAVAFRYQHNAEDFLQKVWTPLIMFKKLSTNT